MVTLSTVPPTLTHIFAITRYVAPAWRSSAGKSGSGPEILSCAPICGGKNFAAGFGGAPTTPPTTPPATPPGTPPATPFLAPAALPSPEPAPTGAVEGASAGFSFGASTTGVFVSTG